MNLRPPKKPSLRPARPYFASGPCPKPPGWNTGWLADAWLSRSHRATGGRARIAELLARSRDLLELPADHTLMMVPGSGTGAIELLLWNLLGARGVDVLAWDSFGQDWAYDIETELGLTDVRRFDAEYGHLPELPRDDDRDRVFLWNGTTSGVALPGADWIAAERTGLTICDATSAVLGFDLPWSRLDATSYSWQKVLGGEAGFGMVALGPAALERIATHRPEWPLPKLFRLSGRSGWLEEYATGVTINTPSMLAVEDCLAALAWAEHLGGLETLVARSRQSLAHVTGWVEASDWVEFVATDPAWRSPTSICLRIVDPIFQGLSATDQAAGVERLVGALEAEGVANDVRGYRRAPPGIRIWAGATVASEDVAALLPWLDWSWALLCHQGLGS